MQKVNLPFDFFPRDYQVPSWNALMDVEFKRGVMIHPRRCGKDILSWNGMICKAMQHKALYYYVAPYYTQAREIIWEGYDDTGRRFIDYIPKELIATATKNDMRITLVNGSQIKMQGSDEINRLVGTNPYGIVFTEYSLHKPQVWDLLRPILANNGGWAWFNGTPRGYNHLADMFTTAENSMDWFSEKLTRDDTGVPSLKAIEADRESGMPEELIRQEYYTSFEAGSVGTYFADTLNKARREGRVTTVPWDPSLPVHTAWDPGNTSAIWFFQHHQNLTRWIDYEANRGGGFPHLVKILKDKPYAYGTHIGPWDLNVESYDTGVTRKATAAEHGIDFIIMPKLPIEDGIEAAKVVFATSTWDQNKCSEGLVALSQHRAIISGHNKTLSVSSTPDPKTKWASHACDAARYGSIAILDGYVTNETESRILSRRSLGGPDAASAGQMIDLMIANGMLDPMDLMTGGETLHPKPSRRSLSKHELH